MNIDKKLELAHEYFRDVMAFIRKEGINHEFDSIIEESWQYADAMGVEYKKRKQAEAKKDAEDAKVFFEELTKNEYGSCKHFHTTLNHGECFDCGDKLNITDSSKLEQVLHDIDCYFDKTDNTQRDANNLIQLVYERLSGEVLNTQNSMELEWQPDWSVAPEGANYWAMDEDTCCNWYDKEPEAIVIRNRWDFGNVLKFAPSFNYQGDWKDSLRKRPDGKVFFDCIDKCKHDCGVDLTQGLGGFYIKSCKRCGYFVETSEDWKDSLRERPEEKPKQHQCNCSHWKNSSFFMGDTFTCKDCGGSVTI